LVALPGKADEDRLLAQNRLAWEAEKNADFSRIDFVKLGNIGLYLRHCSPKGGGI
jgi:hypothetical protein